MPKLFHLKRLKVEDNDTDMFMKLKRLDLKPMLLDNYREKVKGKR